MRVLRHGQCCGTTGEVLIEVFSSLISPVAVLDQRQGDDPIEVCRQRRHELARWPVLLVKNGFTGGARRRRAERQDTGRGFEEHRAEREEIAPAVNGFAAHLLGAHVGDCAG